MNVFSIKRRENCECTLLSEWTTCSRHQSCTCYFMVQTLNLRTQDRYYPTVHTSPFLVLVFVFIFIDSPILCFLKMLNDAFPLFIGVPESAVPECQCLWCAWVLWEVQWTWGECKVSTSSIFSVKLCTVACKTAKHSFEDLYLSI